jgi:hypothetical protein
MGPGDITAERLGHGYAITAHRSQGSTVDVAHVLDDGGGRELAYVAMSRARTASHVYVTATDPRQAAERLAWTWDQQRRQQWITDQTRAAARTEQAIAELTDERDRLTKLIPPDVTDQLTRVRQQVAQVETDRTDLHAGTGFWAHSSVSQALQALQHAQRTHDHDVLRARDRYLGLLARHRARQTEQASNIAVTQASAAWQDTIRPHDHQLANQLEQLGQETTKLEATQQTRHEFLTAHPEVTARITQIDRAIAQQHHQLRAAAAPRPAFEWRTPAPQPGIRHDHIHQQHIAVTHQAPQIGGPAL